MTASRPKRLLAGIELGGTKCICVLGGPENVIAHERVPTTDPQTTFREIDAVLANWRRDHGRFEALGIAAFGPLDLQPSSRTYGYITSTPKEGWQNVEVVGRFARQFDAPIGFNTDVNGAALAEGRLGASAGLQDFAYITVGTGVGVGIVVNGQTIRGCNHTELGHLRVARDATDTWPGSCLFHGACVEGLASGTAIAARAGMTADLLSPDDPTWIPVVSALTQLLHALVLSTAPRRIVLGGGVMTAQAHLFEKLRRQLQTSLNGYVDVPELTTGIAQYIVPAALGPMAGPLGSLVLAENVLHLP